MAVGILCSEGLVLSDATVAEGFLLEADTDEIKALATAAYHAAHGRTS